MKTVGLPVGSGNQLVGFVGFGADVGSIPNSSACGSDGWNRFGSHRELRVVSLMGVPQTRGTEVATSGSEVSGGVFVWPEENSGLAGRRGQG